MDDHTQHPQYRVRSDVVEPIASKFHPKANKILTEKKWRAAFDKQGRLDISKVLMRVQQGGVDPVIRAEVWEFLLGCYAADSTYTERAAIQNSRREKYFQVKTQCQTMDPAVGSGVVITLPRIHEDSIENQKYHNVNGDKEDIQHPSANSRMAQLRRSPAISKNIHTVPALSAQKKIIQWQLTLHQIGLDVVRTDRALEFYEKQSNLAKLWDILAVYSWLDPDVGYGQGMSDLCSPMVVLFENEADAFWCFERLMHRLRDNFKCTEQAVGVQKQLQNLGLVLQVVDPKLHKHLEDMGGGSFIFAFRMLMVLFRREFSFSDSLYLWEIMWSLEYEPDFNSLDAPQHRFLRRDSGNSWIIRKGKSHYRWGKFERQKNKYGEEYSHDIPFVVFCAASIFESQRMQLRQAPDLDEILRILNDVTGKLDARRACSEALKIHKKYLLKATEQKKGFK